MIRLQRSLDEVDPLPAIGLRTSGGNIAGIDRFVVDIDLYARSDGPVVWVDDERIPTRQCNDYTGAFRAGVDFPRTWITFDQALRSDQTVIAAYKREGSNVVVSGQFKIQTLMAMSVTSMPVTYVLL